ncbi:MAG: hypothetical protein P8177_11235 [Gemmatimonadota bacterium]
MRDAERRVVVWRLGDAVLAVPLADTVEIAAVDGEGRADGRGGALALTPPPGLPLPRRATLAVVVRTAAGATALAADEVLGVRTVADGGTEPVPAWLGALPTAHIEGMIRVDGDRTAALLDATALGPG